MKTTLSNRRHRALKCFRPHRPQDKDRTHQWMPLCFPGSDRPGRFQFLQLVVILPVSSLLHGLPSAWTALPTSQLCPCQSVLHTRAQGSLSREALWILEPSSQRQWINSLIASVLGPRLFWAELLLMVPSVPVQRLHQETKERGAPSSFTPLGHSLFVKKLLLSAPFPDIRGLTIKSANSS